MAPTVILTPVIALLAFMGYVWLLSCRFWIAIVLTLVLSYLVWASTPYDPEQIVYWGAGTGLFAAAILAMSLLPKRESYVIEFRKMKNSKITPKRDIIVDGTNVIFWDGRPSLASLRLVVDYLQAKGFMPYVFLDGTSRHLIRDNVLDEAGYAKALGLKKERVMLCPDRTEADEFIMGFARDHGLAVVSNDYFEDTSEAGYEVRFFKGILADGHPVLQGM
ncbi:MAG: hypothetical protein AAF943_00980 [Pseudomonadota bacterium]